MGREDEPDFTTPLGIFCCVFCPWFFALYYMNRKVYPLAQREPMITLGANIAFWLATQIWTFEIRFYAIPCIVDNIATQILVGITMALFCMKVWKIYLDAGLTNELEKDQHGWFVAHRRYRSRKALNTVAGAMIAFHCFMFLVATLDDAEHAFARGNTCAATTSSLILAGLAVIYTVVFLLASCKLARVKDNFFIKSELRLTGIGSGGLALAWLTVVAADLPCTIPECQMVLLWLCWFICFLASTIYPLTKAMWDRRFLWWWDLCRRSVFQRMMKETGSRIGSEISRGENSRTDVSLGRSDTAAEDFATRMINPSTERNPMRVLSSHLNPRDPAVARLKQLPLKRLLAFDQGKEAFRRFTVMEFSVENLLFTDAVIQFRALEAPTKRDVDELYETYVSERAPRQVNLPIKIVRQIKEQLGAAEGPGSRTFFDAAYDHVMRLMQRDSYRRFQDTAEFVQLASTIQMNRLSISQEDTPQITETGSFMPPTPQSQVPRSMISTDFALTNTSAESAPATKAVTTAIPFETQFTETKDTISLEVSALDSHEPITDRQGLVLTESLAQPSTQKLATDQVTAFIPKRQTISVSEAAPADVMQPMETADDRSSTLADTPLTPISSTSFGSILQKSATSSDPVTVDYQALDE